MKNVACSLYKNGNNKCLTKTKSSPHINKSKHCIRQQEKSILNLYLMPFSFLENKQQMQYFKGRWITPLIGHRESRSSPRIKELIATATRMKDSWWCLASQLPCFSFFSLQTKRTQQTQSRWGIMWWGNSPLKLSGPVFMRFESRKEILL